MGAQAEVLKLGQRLEVGQTGRCAGPLAMAAMPQATFIASIDQLHPVGLVKNWGLRQIRGGSHLLIAQDEAVALAERLDVRPKGQRLQLLLGEVVRRYGCPHGDVAHLNHKIRLIA